MATSGRGRNTGLAITALCSVQFVDVLGVTVVVTALPRMLADLKAPAAAGSLVSGGYAIFFGGLLMLLAIYFVGAEQGATALFHGAMVHEFVHDGRHLLGFPCH